MNKLATKDSRAETVAKWFHEAYERLAPKHGYKTRDATAVPWEDVPESNRALMIETAAEVLARLETRSDIQTQLSRRNSRLSVD